MKLGKNQYAIIFLILPIVFLFNNFTNYTQIIMLIGYYI